MGVNKYYSPFLPAMLEWDFVLILAFQIIWNNDLTKSTQDYDPQKHDSNVFLKSWSSIIIFVIFRTVSIQSDLIFGELKNNIDTIILATAENEMKR